MKKVFVCSPLRPTEEFSFEENVALARRLTQAAINAGVAPFTPHLFYPQFLNEFDAGDRMRGIMCGLTWMVQSDALWVYADKLEQCSDGMRMEIDRAMSCAIPPVIVYMSAAWAKVPPRVRS